MGTATGALKARQRRQAARAEAPDDCKLLLAGIDSLHLSSAAELRADLVTDLLALKAEASECSHQGLPLPRFRTNLVVNGEEHVIDLEVQPRGTRKGDLLLKSNALDLVLHSRPPKNLPAAYVELHALFLWTGWDRASDIGAALLRDVAAVPASADVQTSRIDLAADFCGWTPDEGLKQHLRGRFRRWTKDYEPTRDREHGYGRRFTGFTFGGGPLLCRMYDKTVELRVSNKYWFVPKWTAAGYVDEKTSGHVWRVEFQVRREILRKCQLVPHELKTKDGTDDREMKRWDDVKIGLNDLWRYLTTQWLTYQLPRTNRVRFRLHPRWVTLMRAKLTPLPDGQLFRHNRLANMNRCLGALGGYLKHEYALDQAEHDKVPSEENFDADLVRLVQLAAKYYEQKHGESLFDASRGAWKKHITDEPLFTGRRRLGRAKPEQLGLGSGRARS